MPKSILVIDDDVSVRLVLRRMLEQEGYKVTCAEDGREGLDLLKQLRPDLVITDIVMPNREGIETILEMRAAGLAVPIIAMSGGGRVGNADFLQMAQRLGASATLTKPFELDELAALVRDQLRERRERVIADAAGLAEAYGQWFNVLPANTPELLIECFRLRYQVYCLERGFEERTSDCRGLETDAHDLRSLHGLLQHRGSSAFVGTIRLVLPDRSPAAEPLPMYRAFAAQGGNLAALPAAERIAEISRFAVSGSFRRRPGDGSCGRVEEGERAGGRRIVPHVTLGLMGLALRMSRGRDLDHVCALMEPSLIRLLSRLGIHWQPVGPLLDHRGLRQPCIARIDELLANIESERPDIFATISRTSLAPAVSEELAA